MAAVADLVPLSPPSYNDERGAGFAEPFEDEGLTRLPNAEKAIVDGEKLREYVLSPTHPVGRFKAAFFRRFGYSAQNWDEFEQCLRQLILSEDVTGVEETRYGQKYVVEGAVMSPSGEPLQLVTVWVILKGHGIPRFVTAYPRGSR